MASINIVLFQNCGKFSTNLHFNKEPQAKLSESSFESAKRVLSKNCVSCHQAGGAASATPLNFKNEEEFVASGLVSPGSPDRSKLIFRLRNYIKSGAGLKNMPPNTTLPEADYDALFRWVTTLNLEKGPFTCKAEPGKEDVVSNHAKRLSLVQYKNTLNDLLLRFLPAGDVQAILPSILSGANFPTDSGERYKRWDNNFDQAHIRAFFSVADQLSQKLVEETYYAKFVSGIIKAFAGECMQLDVNNLSSSCQRQLVRNLGLRMFRRPLIEDGDDNELDLMTELNAGDNRDGVANLMMRLLLAPAFLMQVEDHESAVEGVDDLLKLSDYAIINRLSYTFWNTMPDETLFAIADEKDLHSEAVFEAALDHVFSQDQRLSHSVREFMHDGLMLEETPHFKVDTEAARLMAGGITFDDQMRTDMINEIEELGEYVTRTDLGFADLFTTNISFARTPELMKLYGVKEPAPMTVTPENAVKMARTGLLTRAGLLATESGAQNPVMRGIRLRREFMCLAVNPPPADNPDVLTPPPYDPTKTIRERFDIKTSPTLCMGCHRVINPLGFVLSNYNGFGIHQTMEPAFAEDGTFNNQYLPVDSKVDLSDVFEPGSTAESAHQLSQLIAERVETKKCFAEEFSKYALLRAPQPEIEGCRLNRMFRYLHGEASLKDFMRSLARDPQFRHRKITAEEATP